MAKGVVLGDRISEIFGRRHSISSIVTSASLAIICLFYVYTAGTYFQVRIYPLVDRVTYYIPFNFYIINEFVDHVIIGSLLVLWLALSVRHRIGRLAIGIFAVLFMATAATNYDPALGGIALSALPSIVSILIYDHYSSRKILQNRLGLTRNYIAIIGIITGLISLGFAVSSAAFPSDNSELPLVRSYAHDIFLLFSSFSPALLILLIACYPVKLLIDYVTVKIKQQHHAHAAGLVQRQISLKIKITYLSLFILLSIAITIIPHLPTVNVDNKQVGWDTGYYVNWVGALNDSANPSEFFYEAFIEQRGGDRPVSLIFLFTLQKATNADLFSVVEYVPLILGPALVLAVYFLTRELTSNDTVSLIAAFLTAISFHALIGIYAGFYANWLALIFGYLGFIFLFRFLKRGGKENLAIYTGLTLLTLFTHVYTWSILAIVAGIFLSVMLKMNHKRKAALLLIALFSTVAIDLARTGLIGAASGFEEDAEIAGRLTGLEQFVLRWNNLTYTTTTFVGGLFANFIIFGLGLYWLYKARMNEPVSIFIIVFLSVGLLPFLFGEWVIQTRVFYDIPFQIPAAVALFHIRRQPVSGGLLRTLPIYIWLIAMSIVAVSNFYLVTPES
jgi:hypothetical protein